jgi:hypothetical protein
MNTITNIFTNRATNPLSLLTSKSSSRISKDEVSFSHLQRQRSKYIPHDPRISSFLHEKTRVLYQFQICVTFAIIMSSFCSIVYESDQLSDHFSGILLSVNGSFLTLMFIGLRCAEIWLDTMKRKSEVNIESEVEINSAYLFRYLSSLLFLVHPNYLTYRLQIIDEQAFSRKPRSTIFRRNFNDYLFLFQTTMLVGKVIVNFLRLSRFSRPRIHRLSRICGFSCTTAFVFKCHLLKDTLITLVAVLCILGFYFSLVFCVTEAPVTMLNEWSTDFFSEPFNFMEAWYFVSGVFLLYGSGDIVVGSYLGVFFATVCSYIGAFNVPFIAVAIERKIKMSQAEEKAYKIENYRSILLKKRKFEEKIRSFISIHTETLQLLDNDRISIGSKLESLPPFYQQHIHKFQSKFIELEGELDKAAEPTEEDTPDLLTHMLILFNQTLNELRIQLEPPSAGQWITGSRHQGSILCSNEFLLF